MRFLLIVAVGAVVIGYLRGGRLGNLSRVPLRLLAVFGLALGIEVVLGFVPGAARLPMLAASYALAAAGIWLLWRTSWARATPWVGVAVVLIALGWAMNAAPIAANGGMPVSRDAMRIAGIDDRPDVTADDFRKHVEATPAASLLVLGDVIPIPGLGIVVSAGDVVLAAGIGLLLIAAMQPPRNEDAAAPVVGRR